MTANTKDRAKFTAQEKAQLITLPWIVGAAVSEIDQVGGARAAARESEALRKAVSRCATVFQSKTGEYLAVEPSAFDFEKAESQLTKACDDALALLEKKNETAENIDLYKSLVLETGVIVAATYGSGILGTGQKVSQTESGMLDKVATALKASHLLEEAKKAAPGKSKK